MEEINKRGILVLVIILVFILFFFNGKWNRKKINQSGRIGIFYVEEITFSKIGPNIKYHYFDNGIKIYDSYPCDDIAEVKKGNRFFGKYISRELESFICCYCPVPNDLIEQPKAGWSNLPVEFCFKEESSCWAK